MLISSRKESFTTNNTKNMSKGYLLWFTSAIILSSIAIVCGEIRGDVTIGTGTRVASTASIIAELGPIIIGNGCIIEARTKIINKSNQVLRIGSSNVFNTGSTIESLKIGNSNVFGANCFVGNQVTVKNGCVIGASVRLTKKQTLTDGTKINKEN